MNEMMDRVLKSVLLEYPETICLNGFEPSL